MATEYRIITLIHNVQPNPEGAYDPIEWDQDKGIAEILSSGYQPVQITTTSGEKGAITLTILFSRETKSVAPASSSQEQSTIDRFTQKAERGY
ncbi:hypothetical protein [Larkinella terrae]|uniref:DUF4177 domain-containing protein n=1 Tax=Larkinella terrae TaxID=2025311 RepID=A0A7K0EJ75_9BACT|nr:hypothetical protein [Larkinella terrae]MRS61867.1 hypothetical protein [Larkinella terrae]